MMGKGETGKGKGAVDQAADAVRRELHGFVPRVAIVLGSGLGVVADAMREPRRIPYSKIPGFPAPGVPGHKGELAAGTLAGVDVLVQQGRFHLYEGHTPATAALPVRVFHRLGVRTLVVTNAAGGLRPALRPGSLMLIADHINLMWSNPLIGPVEPGEERFPDMSDAYDPALRALAREVVRDAEIPLEEGVYVALLRGGHVHGARGYRGAGARDAHARLLDDHEPGRRPLGREGVARRGAGDGPARGRRPRQAHRGHPEEAPQHLTPPLQPFRRVRCHN